MQLIQNIKNFKRLELIFKACHMKRMSQMNTRIRFNRLIIFFHFSVYRLQLFYLDQVDTPVSNRIWIFPRSNYDQNYFGINSFGQFGKAYQ